jgi:transposase
MKSKGTATELEARRRLAVRLVKEGWKQNFVAAVLSVSPKTVNAWIAAYRAGGDSGLEGKPRPGAKPKLSKDQERSVRSRLIYGPRHYVYRTNRWTTRQMAERIEDQLGVRFNVN